MVRYTTPFGMPRRSSKAPLIEVQQIQSAADAAIGDRRNVQTTTRQYVLPSPISSLAGVPDSVRKLAGLETKRACKMCLQVFPESALKGCISFKAILEQRARWGMVQLRARDIAAGVLYESHKVCVFCSQFFDEEVMALDDASSTLLEANLLKQLSSDGGGDRSEHDLLSRVEADVSSSPPRSPTRNEAPSLGQSLRSSSTRGGRRGSMAAGGAGVLTPPSASLAPGAMIDAAAPSSMGTYSDSAHHHPRPASASAPPRSPSKQQLQRPSLIGPNPSRDLEDKFARRVLSDVIAARRESAGQRNRGAATPSAVNKGTSTAAASSRTGTPSPSLKASMEAYTRNHERRTAALLRLREQRRAATPAVATTAALRRRLPVPSG